MIRKHTLRSCLFLTACLALAPVMSSCVENVDGRKDPGVVNAFVIKTLPVNGSYGTDAAPLTFATAFASGGICPAGETCFNISLAAYAVDIEGNFLPNYNGTVSISSEPGKLDIDSVTFVNGMVGTWAMDPATGKPLSMTSGIDVGIRYANGPTRIWIEDKDEVNRALMPGLKCPNDRITENGLNCEPTLSTGVSEEYTFKPQTIKMIQYNPEQKDGQSPLNKVYGQLKALPGHDLVVTNVVSTGFYVTDLGDAEYNSIFIFTYSQPARVEIGDRVCEISGGIAEFTGMTQLQFPSWGIQNKERSTAEDTDPAPEDGEQGTGSCIDKETGLVRPCTDEELETMAAIVDCSNVYYDHKLTKAEKKVFAYIEPPTPRIITPGLLSLKNADSTAAPGIDGSKLKTNPTQTNALERLESSVVTIEDIRLSTDFINCDDNGNSKIESGSEEAECRTVCQSNSKRCTELSNLESYDQWKAWTIDGNAEISVASSSLIANFDITKGCYNWFDADNRHNMRCPERHLKRLTGNLKQVLPGCSGDTFCYSSKWNSSMVMSVIEPRFSTDLIPDEAFNAASEAAFNECISDSRVGGCLEACKKDGAVCTCAAFATYRANDTTKDPTLPTTCPASI